MVCVKNLAIIVIGVLMKVFIFNSYRELSQKASEDLIGLMNPGKHPLLCVASGDSPSGLYSNIVTRVHKKELDITGWSFIGLDEWVGMNASDEGSCRFYL